MIIHDHLIRDLFPALARRHRGLPVAYFDGPGGTQVPQSVADAMTDYLLHHNANTHWAYPTSEETDAMLLESRRVMAEFLNGRPEEVVFGQNMTTLTFHLARGLGRRWGPGDEIVVTDLDHHANRAPWEALAADRGVTVRSVPFSTTTGLLDGDALGRMITRRTQMVAIGAASNALGTVTDVGEACALARAAGALTFVDAVHSAPHILPDVADIGCDFLACSPYKFYGPHQGVLWGREGLLTEVDVPRLAPAPQTSPERLETGTMSHEGMVGSAEAVRILASLVPGQAGLRQSLAAAYRVIHTKGQALFARMWEGLARIPGVRLYGPPPDGPRTPTLAFTVRGIASEAVARCLATRAIFVSHGDFYAATVVERLGLSGDGLVRAGCACYTTEDEVERLVEGVEMITNDHE